MGQIAQKRGNRSTKQDFINRWRILPEKGETIMSAQPTTPSRYLSIREVAEILAVSPSTVRNLVQSHQLPAILTGTTSKTVRIAMEDLTAYLVAHRTVPLPDTAPPSGRMGQ